METSIDINRKRNINKLLLSSLIGGLLLSSLSTLVEGVLLTSWFKSAVESGTILKTSRLPFFVYVWGILLFIVSFIINYIYSSIKGERKNLKTALIIGMSIGFCVSCPMNFSTAVWMPADPILSYLVMAYLWVGSIGVSLISYLMQK